MVGFMRQLSLSLALSFALAAHVLAQERLPDPTKPGIAENLPGSAASTHAEAEAEPLRLESVLLGKQRQQAIISGEIYQVGQMVGKAKLVKISAQEVVLLQNGKTQKLALFPDVEKKLHATLKTKR